MINPHQINQIQQIAAGNRCGHFPDAPRFFVRPEKHKRRPSILENAIEKLKDVYRRPKKFFGTLVTFHSHDRQIRSERREAIVSVSQVFLHYLELSTLRVGFYTGSGEFIPLDLMYIAKKANITVSRAKRAIESLVCAGYLKVSRQFTKKEDGTFKGKASIRELSARFFIDLGVDAQSLFFSREWKRKKDEKTVAKDAKKKMSGLMQAVRFGARKRIYSSMVSHKPAIDPNLIKQALESHRVNPERSCSDYLQELLQWRT